jgi:hypothetical protein
MAVEEVVAIVVGRLRVGRPLIVHCGCECDVWWMVVVERWCARLAPGFAAVSR